MIGSADMQTASVPLDRLRDAPRNANVLSDVLFRQLIDSIQRIGFVVPIVARDLGDGDFEIVDGHHRKRALTELHHTHAWTLVVQPNEDPRLVALALNRLRGQTDLAIAGEVLHDLLSDGAELEHLLVTGFDADEIKQLVSALEQPDLDLDDLAGAGESPPEPDPVVRPFYLELTFHSRDDLAEVKRALKKAAGKGGDIADGLLRLIRAS
jgi:ParB-like chromosome segregation protein Spo0J